MLSALRIRNAIRKSRMSREMAMLLRDGRGPPCMTSSSFLDACWSVEVDNMAPTISTSNLHATFVQSAFADIDT